MLSYFQTPILISSLKTAQQGHSILTKTLRIQTCEDAERSAHH